MRLTCPNCGAHYEVPETAIPETGRDVQCSACGETWAQHRPDAAPRADEDGPPPPPPAPAPDPAEAPASEPLAQPAQRRLDPEVADILRTEAARERAQRAAEATGDLGARHAGASPAAPQGPGRATRDAAGPASHPGTLPDMDEIGSSLTPTRGSTARPHPAEPPQTAGRGGFRAGFWVAMLAVGLAAILYVAAPDVVDLVPGAEAPVERYVAAVNDARLRLDAFVDRMMARMSGG